MAGSFTPGSNTNLKRYMHPSVHSRNFYNRQDVDATYVSINRGQDQDVVLTCSGRRLSREKNEMMPFAATWVDLEGTVLSEIRQRKANTVDITYMWHPNQRI